MDASIAEAAVALAALAYTLMEGVSRYSRKTERTASMAEQGAGAGDKATALDKQTAVLVAEFKALGQRFDDRHVEISAKLLAVTSMASTAHDLARDNDTRIDGHQQALTRVEQMMASAFGKVGDGLSAIATAVDALRAVVALDNRVTRIENSMLGRARPETPQPSNRPFSSGAGAPDTLRSKGSP